ncbi:hypothetical protein E2C01_000432 [Portunus trituberculatus]|uniref:Uncharacterized protein n=1 Tax=Portunus trituberculatus TaxID=210409 RepID=A0A5B7CGK6_PORTR|nr:hypothetical protein [Portunus trituberculatus]
MPNPRHLSQEKKCMAIRNQEDRSVAKSSAQSSDRIRPSAEGCKLLVQGSVPNSLVRFLLALLTAEGNLKLWDLAPRPGGL